MFVEVVSTNRINVRLDKAISCDADLPASSRMPPRRSTRCRRHLSQPLGMIAALTVPCVLLSNYDGAIVYIPKYHVFLFISHHGFGYANIFFHQNSHTQIL